MRAQRSEVSQALDSTSRRIDSISSKIRLVGDQGRGELDDGVAAVVGTAVEAGLEEGAGEEAAQQALGLVVVEGLLGRLVLDQLDAVEVPVAADIADDGQVVEFLQGGPEVTSVSSTCSSSCSRSKMSRLAIATAVETGWPPNV